MFLFQIEKLLKEPDTYYKEMNYKFYMYYNEEDVKHLNNGEGILIEMDEKTYRKCLNEFDNLDVQKVRKMLFDGKLNYLDYNEKAYKEWIKTGDTYVIGTPKKAPKIRYNSKHGVRVGHMRFANDKAIIRRLGRKFECPCVIPFDELQAPKKFKEEKHEIITHAGRNKVYA